MMFNFFWGEALRKTADQSQFLDLPSLELLASQPASSHKLPWWILPVAVGLVVVNASCRMIPAHIPPANLAEPGWTVHQGQAVWHLPKVGRDIAGEVLVATRPEGRAFVQFTKAPFPIVTGQTAANCWEVEFPPQNKHFSGHGRPPKRILWLYLPRALVGEAPPGNWTWSMDRSSWRLENRSNGEALEGYFEQ